MPTRRSTSTSRATSFERMQRWGYDVRYREYPGWAHEDLQYRDEIIAWFLQPAPGRGAARGPDPLDRPRGRQRLVGSGRRRRAAARDDRGRRRDDRARATAARHPQRRFAGPVAAAGAGRKRAAAGRLERPRGRGAAGRRRRVPARLAGRAARAAAQARRPRRRPFQRLRHAVRDRRRHPARAIRRCARLVREKAEALAAHWQAWQHVRPRLVDDTAVTPGDGAEPEPGPDRRARRECGEPADRAAAAAAGDAAGGDGRRPELRRPGRGRRLHLSEPARRRPLRHGRRPDLGGGHAALGSDRLLAAAARLPHQLLRLDAARRPPDHAGSGPAPPIAAGSRRACSTRAGGATTAGRSSASIGR